MWELDYQSFGFEHTLCSSAELGHEWACTLEPRILGLDNQSLDWMERDALALTV